MACTLVKQNCRCSYLQQEVRGVVNTHDQTSDTQHVIYIREADQAYGGQMMNEHNEEILQVHKTYVKRGHCRHNTKIFSKINTKSETSFSLTGSLCKHKQDLRYPDWLNKEEHYISVMIALCILLHKSLATVLLRALSYTNRQATPWRRSLEWNRRIVCLYEWRMVRLTDQPQTNKSHVRPTAVEFPLQYTVQI